MKTKLLVIRHGQSTANLESLFAGHYDAALTELGQKQAQCTADYLKDTHIDVLYASDLSRAQCTALPIATSHKLPLRIDRDLREMFFGDIEGVPLPEYEKTNPEFVRQWVKDFTKLEIPGGESAAELLARVNTVLDKIVHENKGKTVCIVTHGNTLRAMCCAWHTNRLEDLASTPIPSNASVCHVTWEDGVYTVEQYGYDAHLADMRTVVAEEEAFRAAHPEAYR